MNGDGEALRASEEQFRLVMSSGDFAAWDWDVVGGGIEWTDAHYAMQGYAVGEVEPSYAAWEERVHPDDRAPTVAALLAARDARTTYDHTFRVVFPDGTIRWHSAQGRFFYDERGTAVRMIGVVRDVTVQRAALDALRHSEERQTFLLALSDALRPLTAAADIQSTASDLLGRHLLARVDTCEHGAAAWLGEDWLREFADGEPVVVNDVRADLRLPDDARARLLAADIAAFIVAVQVRDGRWIADLAVHHAAPRGWTKAAVQLTREVAVRIRDARERCRFAAVQRASEAKYRSLFETMTQGYGLFELVRDAAGTAVDYRILELNPASERHLGVPVAALIGRTVYALLPTLDPAWLATYVRLIATGEPSRFELYAAPLDRWFDNYAYPRGGDRFALLFDDISERRRRERVQAILAAISDELVSLDNIAEMLRRVGERVGRFFAVRRCVLTDHADGGESTGSWRTRDLLVDAAAAALQRGEPVVVRDTRTDPCVHADRCAALGLRSCLIVPLVRDRRWRFQVFVGDDEPRAWRDAEVDLLREIVARVWARLEPARAEAALNSSEAWLAGQKEAFQLAVQGAALTDSLGVLVRTTVEQAGDGTRCAFYLADPTGAELHHVVGMPEAYARAIDGFKIGPHSPACGLAVYQGLPVLTADVDEDPLWAPWRGLAAQTGFRACWSFPIEATSGRMIGTFAMYHREPRDATPRDLAVAAVVTRAAAIIISRSQEADERARVEAALRVAEERFRLALSAARMGTWTWDMASDRHRRDANLNALLGLPAEVTVQPLRDLLDRIHPDERERVARTFDRSVRQGRPMSVEFRVTLPDGTTRWLRDQGDVFGAIGQAQLTGACVDVTDLKEAEAALRQANSELEARVAARTAELAAEMERRRDLTRRLGKAQEDERQRVARDLHDSIGQLLAGLSMAFKAVENVGVLPPAVAARLVDAQEISAALGKEVHSLAVRLRPTSLDDIGLAAALSQLVREWSVRTGIEASFHAPGAGADRLSPEVETTIYRVVQEALTNVARHARAGSAGVIVRRPAGFVSVVIEDDGVGFDPAVATDRLGLLGMRERVDLVGGELEIEASPGAGTTLLVTIPCPQEGLP